MGSVARVIEVKLIATHQGAASRTGGGVWYLRLL